MKEILSLRSQIDRIHSDLVLLFAERVELAKKIAQYKKRENLPLTDETREMEIISQIRQMAKEKQMSPVIFEEMFTLFLDYCKLEMVLHYDYNARP
jgi:chorismate mutase